MNGSILRHTTAIVIFSGMGLSLTTTALAQTRLSPAPIVWDQSHATVYGAPPSPSIYFLIAGPHGGSVYGGNSAQWRISLSREEIYCAIELDYIEIQEEYEGLPRIVSSYRLNGRDVAPLIGTDSDFLHNLQFVAWEDWDRVLMKEGDRYFRIQINTDHSFDIVSAEEM